MKKIVSLILALTLCLGMIFTLASCKKKTDFTVGIAQLVQHAALDAATNGFKDALIEELAKAGKTVTFKEQNAGGEISTCSSIVGAFVSNNVDLILANATPMLQAATKATTSIPILGTSVTEYGVALGIENFNGTVGTNVSGTSDLAPLDQQAQMMIDTLGLVAGNKVGLLFCSAEPNSKYQVDVIKAELEKHYGDRVFTTTIGRNVRLSEAPSFGKPILYHDKRAKGALDYMQLAKELHERP